MKLRAGAPGDRVRAGAGRAWLAFPGRVRHILQRDYLELLIVVLAWATLADAALKQLLTTPHSSRSRFSTPRHSSCGAGCRSPHPR